MPFCSHKCGGVDHAKLHTGKLMPMIGLGTWQSNDDVVEVFCKAIEIGYRYIDTAFLYQNEREVGAGIKAAIDRGLVKREDLFVLTKLPGHAYRHVKALITESLNRLGLDYVDMYLLHFPMCLKYENVEVIFPMDGENIALDNEASHLETWTEMEKLVDEGLVRHIGLSNFNSEQIQNIYDHARIKPANLQIESHIYLQQEELLQFCKKLNIQVTGYMPFGSPGMNKVLGIQAEDRPAVLENHAILEIAKKHGKTPGQVALRYQVQRGIIVIPKSTNPDRQKQNISIFDFKLDCSDMKKLKEQDAGDRHFRFDFFPNFKDSPHFPFNIPF